MNTNLNYNIDHTKLLMNSKSKIITGMVLVKDILFAFDYSYEILKDSNFDMDDFNLSYSLISEGIATLKSITCNMDLIEQCSTCMCICKIEVYLNHLSILKHIPIYSTVNSPLAYFLVDNLRYLLVYLEELLALIE